MAVSGLTMAYKQIHNEKTSMFYVAIKRMSLLGLSQLERLVWKSAIGAVISCNGKHMSDHLRLFINEKLKGENSIFRGLITDRYLNRPEI